MNRRTPMSGVPLSITAWIRATSCYGTSFPSILIRLRLFQPHADGQRAGRRPRIRQSPAAVLPSRYPPGRHRQEIGRNPAKCRLPGPGHAPSGKRWCQPLPGTVRTFFPIIPLKNRLNLIFTLNLSAFLRKHARKSLHRLHKLFIIIGTPQYIRAFSLIQ